MTFTNDQWQEAIVSLGNAGGGGGSGGGTQYSDAGTPPTPSVGTALVWDNAGSWIHVSAANPWPVTIKNATALGQSTMSASAPVAIASNQSPVPINMPVLEVIGNGPSVVNAINTLLIPATDVSAYAWLSLQIAGTWAATLIFEGCNDGATWQSVSLWSVIASGGFQQSTTFNTTVAGPRQYRWFRVRASAFTSNASLAATLECFTAGSIQASIGAQQVGTWTVQPGNTANTTAWKVDGSAVTQPVSGTFWQTTQPISGTFWPTLGTNTMPASSPVTIATDDTQITAIKNSVAAMVQGSGAAAGTAWRIKGDFTEQASLTAGSLNADLVPSTDVSAYKSLSLHINTNAYVGTLTFQGSNDNANWISVNMINVATSGIATSTGGTNIMFAGPVLYRYFRCRMTAYTSGTAQGTLELYTYQFTQWSFGSVGINAGTNVIGGVTMPTSATGTLTSVAGATSNTQLLASNTSRKGMYVFNDSTAIMYLAFNATASTTSYTVQVPAGGFFEMPTAPVYTGQINAVWSTANGNARISEMS